MKAWTEQPEAFRAPCCGAALRYADPCLICEGCGGSYPIRNGIAILLTSARSDPELGRERAKNGDRHEERAK